MVFDKNDRALPAARRASRSPARWGLLAGLLTVALLGVAGTASAFDLDKAGLVGKDDAVASPLAPVFGVGGSWSDIDLTTGTTMSPTTATMTGSFPIGFSYTHMGTTYTNAYLYGSGFLSFNGVDPTSTTVYPIDDTWTPDQIVAGWYVDELAPDCAGTVLRDVQGTAPYRVFVLEYEDTRVTWANNCSYLGSYVTMQWRLYETFDTAEVHYKTAGNLDDLGDPNRITIGIRGSPETNSQAYHHSTTASYAKTNDVTQWRPYGVVPVAEDDPVNASRTQDITDGGTTLTVIAANGTLPNDIQVGAAPIEAEYVAGSADTGLTVNYVNADGSFEVEFTLADPCSGGPAGDGVYSFDYELKDAWTEMDPSKYTRPQATVSVQAVECNQPPTVDDKSVTATEDVALSIALTASDPDAEPLKYSLASAPSFGTVTGLPGGFVGTPPTLTYKHDAQKYNDGLRFDTFIIKVEDAAGATDTATVTVDTKPANDPPVLSLVAELKAKEDEAKTWPSADFLVEAKAAGDATALAFDEADQGLSLSVLTACDAAFFLQCPAVTQTATDPPAWDLVYQPAADVNGFRTITLRLADDGTHMYGGPGTPPAADPKSVDASLKIVVDAVNDVPTLVLAGPLGTLEDQGASHAKATWLASAAPGPSTATDETAGQTGTLSYAVKTPCDPASSPLFATCPSIDPATKALSYVPKPDVSGSAVIQIEVTDDGTLDASGPSPASAAGDLTLVVGPVNDAPSFTAGGTLVVVEDSLLATLPWAGGISRGPADEASQTLTFVLSGVDAAFFDVTPTIDATTGEVTFRPKADVAGTTTATVVLVDSGGTADGGVDTSASKILTIQVTPSNDPPVAMDDAYSVFENRTDSPLTVLTNDHDVDGDALSIIAVSAPLHGNVTVAGSKFLYSPDFDFSGPDTFTYTITDGQETDTATVDLEVADPLSPLVEVRKDPGDATCTGDTVMFEGEAHYKGQHPTEFRWRFGDGATTDAVSTEYLDEQVHAYTGKAVVVVSLTVVFDNGVQKSATVDHQILRCEPPTARFTPFPQGLLVRFRDESFDPDGTIVSYEWSLGDGTLAFADEPVHTYAAYGQKTVVLTVTDDEGFTDSYAANIVIQPYVPASAFGPGGSGVDGRPAGTSEDPSADGGGDAGDAADGGDGTGPGRHLVAVAQGPEAAVAGTVVHLDGSASSGDGPLTYSWRQVTGPSATLLGASSAEARFTVPVVASTTDLVFELEVSDGEAKASDAVTVHAGPAPRPTPSFTTVVDPDEPRRVTFRETSYSHGPDATLTWDFGDGSPPAQGSTVTHTFPGTGEYAVRLVVEDPVQGQGEHAATLDVGAAAALQPPPPQDITAPRPDAAPDAQASLPTAVVPAMAGLAFLAAAVLGAVLVALFRRR